MAFEPIIATALHLGITDRDLNEIIDYALEFELDRSETENVSEDRTKEIETVLAEMEKNTEKDYITNEEIGKKMNLDAVKVGYLLSGVT